jgi:hypothetical protein
MHSTQCAGGSRLRKKKITLEQPRKGNAMSKRVVRNSAHLIGGEVNYCIYISIFQLSRLAQRDNELNR